MTTSTTSTTSTRSQAPHSHRVSLTRMLAPCVALARTLAVSGPPRFTVALAVATLVALAGCDAAPSASGERSAWSDAGGRAPNASRTLDPSADGPTETIAPLSMVNKPSVILVRDFTVAHPTPNADAGGRPRLLPGLLRGVRSDLSQSQLVGQLSASVVNELERRGYNAKRATSGSLPRSGWLVQGTFVEFVNADGNFVTDRWAKQDAELTISIDDLVRGEPEPLTDFTVTGTASGEGAPMMPNPYAAGAKFVVRQAELSGDAGSLASRIADAIVRFAQSEHVLPGARSARTDRRIVVQHAARG